MKSRVVSSCLLAPIVLVACVVQNPFPLFLIALLVATLAFWELRTLFGQGKALPVLTLFGLAIPFFGTEVQQNRDPVQIILYASVFWIAGIAFASYINRTGKSHSANVDMAGLWISMPLTCLLMVHRMHPPHPPTVTFYCWPLLILIPLWGGDIAGLLVGSKFGKHLLAPSLSPNKTWEGSIANLVACIGLSVAMLPVLGDSGRLALHIVTGSTIGVAGQAGDLFESWIKRLRGVKDSGSILPGHGGVLDRIDSFLFSAPLVCLELAFAFLH